MLSKRWNETVIVLDSQRQPGYCLQFNHTTKNLYRCVRCFELGKQRTITIVDRKVIGRKNPKDDHHPDCRASEWVPAAGMRRFIEIQLSNALYKYN